MKSILILSALLAGCATQLGYVNPQPDKTLEQRDIAMTYCIKQAELTQEAPGRIATSAVLSATLVGAPLASHLRRQEMREVFAACMKERGFTVTPPQ